jgi:hypothetical protein
VVLAEQVAVVAVVAGQVALLVAVLALEAVLERGSTT